MGVITRIKANLSSTELGLTSQLELSLAIIEIIKLKNYLILLGGGGRSPKDFIRLQGGRGGYTKRLHWITRGRGQFGSTQALTKYQRKSRF